MNVFDNVLKMVLYYYGFFVVIAIGLELEYPSLIIAILTTTFIWLIKTTKRGPLGICTKQSKNL